MVLRSPWKSRKQKGAPIDDETITSVKSGLMGPMAGVGDSLDWATFKPIIFALGATLSAQGSPIDVSYYYYCRSFR